MNRHSFQNARVLWSLSLLIGCGKGFATPANPATATPTTAPAEDLPFDVLLVSLDTVRWSSTTLSGYERDTTPNLAAFASLPGSVVFSRAYTNGAWSMPAYASLFTGQDAMTHGVGFLRAEVDPAQSTMADMMAAYGYTTTAYCSGPHIAPETGLNRGFQSFHHITELRTIAIHIDDALEYLLTPSDSPRFTFVHGYDAHTPYTTPALISELWAEDPRPHVQPTSIPGWRSTRPAQPKHRGEELSDGAKAHMRAHYDSSVYYADHQLGRLLYGLEVAGRLDRTIVIVMSDHGEMVGEEGGMGHDTGHNDLVFHVPLVIRIPSDAPPQTIDRLVSLSDLLPTMAALIGAVPPAGIEGHVIGELLTPAVPTAPHLHRAASRCCYYVRDGEWEAAFTRTPDIAEWTLMHDGENADFASTETARLDQMKALVATWPDPIPNYMDVNRKLVEKNAALKDALVKGGYWDEEAEQARSEKGTETP